MNDWIACLIGIVIGVVLVSYGKSRKSHRPIITHKCSVCGKNYWTRGK